MLEFIGLVGTFAFGTISVLQFIRDWKNKQMRQREAAHLLALGQSLAHLRLLCNDAIERGEVIRSEPTKQFVRQIAYGLLTAEAQVAALTEPDKTADKALQKPSG